MKFDRVKFVKDAKHMMQWLAERGVDYIEQPLKEGEENELEKTEN